MAGDRVREFETELARLRLRLAEAEQTLEAIRAGEVDSLVVEGPDGLRVYALEGTSNSYRVLMESMNEGAATLTEQGVVLYCNNRFARMLAAPLQRVMGSSLRERVSEQSRDAFDALLGAAQESESRSEITLQSMNGEEIPAYLSLSAIEDQGRQVLCMVATDLRDQKRNDEVVRAERLARSVLEQAAEAIVVCDDQRRITRASKAAAELSGTNPLFSLFDDAFPVRLSGRAEEDSSPAVAALRGESLRALPGTLERRDGKRLELLVSAAPLLGGEQQPLGCVITMSDVTEARHAEERLRQSEERLRLALEGAMQGIWERDIRTGALVWDERCRKLFGLADDEQVTFERFSSIIHPDDRERVLKAVEAAECTRSSYRDEYRVVLPDRTIRWLLARGQVFCQEDRPAHLSGTMLDVTDRKLYEESLREADRRKNQFLAVLSHELRNPLTPMKNSMYILRRAAPGGAQAKRAQEVIERQLAQLSRLVDDLLDTTRIARNKIELRPEILELNELVCRTVEDYRAQFENAGVRLEVHPLREPTLVRGDGARLAQVVGNLLQNAAKFTWPGGSTSVTVRLSPDDQHVAVHVSDTGEGIPPDMLDHLFEPFAQADRTLDRSKGGLGLGLALVKSIVELHGGEVRAHSAGPDRGAEFTVFLPLVGPAAIAPEQDFGVRSAKRRKILIVEDNTDAADTLKEVLELQGQEVEVAYSGPEALEKARRFCPDIVFCDIGLPGMDGYEVARALRSEAKFSDTLLVALTGYALPDDLERAAEAGFDRHLTKPPMFEQINAMLGSSSDD
jgi:PAS domain S-box-containing protein